MLTEVGVEDIEAEEPWPPCSRRTEHQMSPVVKEWSETAI